MVAYNTGKYASHITGRVGTAHQSPKTLCALCLCGKYTTVSRNPDMTTMCRRFLVSGRVQGVFYRSSTQQRARELGLCGWVRNRRDGRVELLASGSEEKLDELEKWLEIGPEYAKVTNIEVITENHADIPITFEVFPTI